MFELQKNCFRSYEMSMLRPAQVVFVAIAICQMTHVVAADDGEFHQAISEIATTEAVKQLAGKEFKFDESGFRGQLKARNPKKDLRVKVKKLTLGNDNLKARVAATSVFQLTGSLTQRTSKLDVDAVVKLTVDVSAEVKFLQKGDQFVASPAVHDLKLVVEILSLKPSNLSGGKKLVSRIANQAFKKNKKDILRKVNRSIGEHKIDL